MASLVADYSDSDDDSGLEGDHSQTNSEDTSCTIIKQESDVSDTASNFFSTTDKDSDDDDVNDKCKVKQVKQEPVEKLPNPLTNGQEKLPSIFEAATSRIGTSVFTNPFEEAEQAKNQILQKHVKLTQAAPKKPANQPICFKFKAGKCHMGKNCRFFHDRNNVTTEENSHLPNPVVQHQRQVYHPAAYHDARRRPLEQEPIDEDNYMAGMHKKKRFGVNDNLLPPKRALESLQRQREVERPWTLPQN